jgi:lipopolysaccharide/colanic/teichoic acid biosynthesis glycosyltransferase
MQSRIKFPEEEGGDWQNRWFVKPGLTGLAQVNDVTATNPQQKLRYDIENICRQSYIFNLTIVIQQIWLVGQEAFEALLNTE